ncbi:MAG TPA: hypothetical protein VHR66_12405 [Gemmataceae bacterium]|jgi:hypothetical protein|nr:hypothetical protein [Gemmataceae bacterium]
MHDDRGESTPADVMSIVVQAWLDNTRMTYGEIAELVSTENGFSIDEEQVRQRLRDARIKKRLHYTPEPVAQLEKDIRAALGLTIADRELDIHVLDTATLQPVARAIAEEIFRRIADLKNEDQIHVGFYGGRTNGLVAQSLSEQLAEAASAKPQRSEIEKQQTRGLHFHSLVGMLDGGEPETDPNAFPIYFQKDKLSIENYLGRRLYFRSFPSPGVATPAEYKELMSFGMIRDRIDHRPEFDVIVCSCGHIKCQHTLTQFIEDSIRPRTVKPPEAAAVSRLREAYETMLNLFETRGVIGDLAWNPITIAGPVPLADLPLRVATMLTLDELLELRRTSNSRTRLIMAAGPCSQPNCQKPKHELIKWALDKRLPHSLYVDRRSAVQYLALVKQKPMNRPVPPTVPATE